MKNFVVSSNMIKILKKFLKGGFSFNRFTKNTIICSNFSDVNCSDAPVKNTNKFIPLISEISRIGRIFVRSNQLYFKGFTEENKRTGQFFNNLINKLNNKRIK